MSFSKMYSMSYYVSKLKSPDSSDVGSNSKVKIGYVKVIFLIYLLQLVNTYGWMSLLCALHASKMTAI